MTAALLGVVMIAAGIWYTRTLSDTAPVSAPTPRDAAPLTPQSYDTDTDGDGVRDWEEALLGFDPHNPDTNNDGVSDAEALAQQRGEAAPAALSDTSATTTEVAPSEALVREVFGTYILSKQEGVFDRSWFDDVLARTTHAYFSERSEARFTLDDITTVPDTSHEAVRAYRDAFAEAIVPVTTITEYELTTYGRAIEHNSAADFEALARAAEVYRGIVDTLLALPVPEDAAQVHLDMIHAFDLFAAVLVDMSADSTDPLASFVRIRDFVEKADAVRIAYSQLDMYFTLKETTP